MNIPLITRHPFGSEITAETLQAVFGRLVLWEDKYRQLILLGKRLPSLPEQLRQSTMAIAGCENQLWFSHAQFPDGRFHFYADSESRVVKGLLAVLLTAVEGKTAAWLLAEDPLVLFDQLDLRRHWTSSRGQGMAALARYIRQAAG